MTINSHIAFCMIPQHAEKAPEAVEGGFSDS